MNRSQSGLVLFLVILVSGLATWQALQVEFDYDFERFFPTQHPQTERYEQFRQDFGYDTNYLLIGLENNAGVFDSAFLGQVDQLTQDLATIDLLERVQSPTNLSYLVREPLFGSFSQVNYLHPQQPERYREDSLRVYQTDELRGTYFSPDGRAVSLYLQQRPDLSEAQCAELADTVDQLLGRYRFDAVHVAGRCVGQTYYTALMQREVIVFVGASVVLIAFFLALLFRSLRGVLVPLAIVGLSVLWTVALMRLTGQPLDVISNVIPSILLVVGLSAVIHIMAKYQEELHRGVPQRSALGQALRQVGSANVLTALTTAIGFLTLLGAQIQPIEAFGLYATAGVVISFGLTYAILPAILPWLPTPPDPQPQNDRLDRWLHRSLQGVIQYRLPILVLTVLLLIGSGYGLSQLKVNNYLLEDLKADNPLQRDFRFYEERFAGARSFELLLTPPDSLGWGDYAAWSAVDSLQRYLRQSYGVGQLVSPLSFIEGLNQAWNGGRPEGTRLPETERRFQRVWRTLQRGERSANLGAYLHGDTLRISGLMPDLGSQVIAERDSALAQWFAQEMPPGYAYQLTGLPTLLDLSNRLVARNVLYGLLVALALIGLLMGLIFRSVRMVLIALVPNLLPLLWIGGLMGAAGIDLKLSTAIIFTIAFGIAVDDTIHFMNRLRWELKAGQSLLYAIKRSFLSTGRAIVLTTLILASGFLVLTLSDFLGTFYIGLLVSLTLVFAVIADLLLLPVLLWYFWGERKER